MSSSVHFKFKSSKEYEALSFDGSEISVADLKKEIIRMKNLGKLMEHFDLNITNAQTREDYKADSMVPKNSSVIVARIPVSKPLKRDNQRRDLAASPTKMVDSSPTLEILSKTKEIASLEISEEEKVLKMMEQSNKDFANINYNRAPRIPTGPVPRNYVCHRCGLPGHFIQSCPRFKDPNSSEPFPRLKRSTGIPNSFMTTVHDINTPGVLLTSSGQLAVPTIDAAAYKEGKKEKPPFVNDSKTNDKKDFFDDKTIPNELLCPICSDILTDAVVVPCCGDSACDECIRNKILASDNHQCPLCRKNQVSPDGLIANKFMRTAVNNFQTETGYMSIAKRTAMQQQREKLQEENERKHKQLLQQQMELKQQHEANKKAEEERNANAAAAMKQRQQQQQQQPLISTGISSMNPLDQASILASTVVDAAGRIVQRILRPNVPQQSSDWMTTRIPIGEPTPIPGIKGARMVRILVARQQVPHQHAPINSNGTTNALPQPTSSYAIPPPSFNVPPPPLVQQYAPPVNRPPPMLVYPNSMPANHLLGPPPIITHAPLSTGAPVNQIIYQPRIAGSVPLNRLAAPPASELLAGGAPHSFNPHHPPGVPMSEEEFYREKERLLEIERRKKTSRSPRSTQRSSSPSDNCPPRASSNKKDLFEFAEDIMNRGKRWRLPKRSRSRSRSFSRSISRPRSQRRSRSYTRRSRSPRHRSRGSSHRKASPRYHHYREKMSPKKSSRSPRRSRSYTRRSRSPRHRSRGSSHRMASPRYHHYPEKMSPPNKYAMKRPAERISPPPSVDEYRSDHRRYSPPPSHVVKRRIRSPLPAPPSRLPSRSPRRSRSYTRRSRSPRHRSRGSSHRMASPRYHHYPEKMSPPNKYAMKRPAERISPPPSVDEYRSDHRRYSPPPSHVVKRRIRSPLPAPPSRLPSSRSPRRSRSYTRRSRSPRHRSRGSSHRMASPRYHHYPEKMSPPNKYAMKRPAERISPPPSVDEYRSDHRRYSPLPSQVVKRRIRSPLPAPPPSKMPREEKEKEKPSAVKIENVSTKESKLQNDVKKKKELKNVEIKQSDQGSTEKDKKNKDNNNENKHKKKHKKEKKHSKKHKSKAKE